MVAGETLQPLVSCVMPTADRRLYVAQAIRYFQMQDYSNKELVILDDGADSVADLVPTDPQIRYVRLSGQRTLGEKRNDCVMAGHGDLIMHWDDDDWMAPHRISYQVEALLREGAAVCGLQRMLYYEQATGRVWLYEYPGNQRPWLAGNSLLYTREFWEQAPFPDVQVASDTLFVWKHTLERRVVLPDYSFYVAMIHPGNTSPKNYNGSYWTRWTGDLESIMGEDLNLYRLMLQPGCTPHTTSRTVTAATMLPGRPSVQAVEPGEHESGHRSETKKARYGRGDVSDICRRVSGDTPVVSCILATHDRPTFVRQAIRCFLRQTYDQSELIVVDDGEQSVAELCSSLYRVRHIRLDSPTSLGSKLNIGVAHARGMIIQKLDDEDYYHPDFLRRAVDSLLGGDWEHHLVAWDCFLVLAVGEVSIRYSGHGWAAGGTLCFHRKLWQRGNFRDVLHAVDEWFMRDHSSRIIRVCAPELYILVQHGSNTWKSIRGKKVDRYFRQLRVYHKPLDALVEPIDLAFYNSLVQ